MKMAELIAKLKPPPGSKRFQHHGSRLLFVAQYAAEKFPRTYLIADIRGDRAEDAICVAIVGWEDAKPHADAVDQISLWREFLETAR